MVPAETQDPGEQRERERERERKRERENRERENREIERQIDNQREREREGERGGGREGERDEMREFQVGYQGETFTAEDEELSSMVLTKMEKSAEASVGSSLHRRSPGTILPERSG